MATQFPTDPNAERFIDGLKMTDDGGAVADLPDEEGLDVEELDDGSAIVNLQAQQRTRTSTPTLRRP